MGNLTRPAQPSGTGTGRIPVAFVRARDPNSLRRRIPEDDKRVA